MVCDGYFKDFIFSTILLIFKGNRDFFKIINDFHDKLPPKNKRAEEITDISNRFTVMNTTNMKMNLTTKDIDLFHKKLENFNYNLFFLKKRNRKVFRKYSAFIY